MEAIGKGPTDEKQDGKLGTGPLLLTFLDGNAAHMFEDLDVEMDLARDGGENVIFERLDERYPQREAEDRMAEVMDDVFELTWNADEDTANFVGRSVQAFARAEQEGVIFPSEARGYMVLRAAQLDTTERAVVLAAAGRSWKLEKISAALRTAFRKKPMRQQRHSAHVVAEM